MKTLKHLFTALLLLWATVATAHDFEVDGIYYNILSYTDKTVEVTYKGSSPEQYKEYNDKKIIIPKTVSYNSVLYNVIGIKGHAFYDSGNLDEISIPSTIENIGYGAFAKCWVVGQIVVEDGNKIYDSRDNCNAIINTETDELIVGCYRTIIPNGVKSIGDYAFYEAYRLEHIELPKSITRIGRYAFYGCTGLEEVEIPTNVIDIDNNAFDGCSNLIDITFPNNNMNIGNNAFNATKWYNNKANGIVYIKNVLYKYKGTMPEGSNIVINDSTLSIAGGAFEKQNGLTSVKLPNTITNIGNYAFSQCNYLTSIEIPSSVESVESNAFYCCFGLKKVHTSDLAAWCRIDFGAGAGTNPLEYAHNLYLNGELVTDLIIPDGVSEIKSDAFYKCTGLTSITIPNSVTSIGDYAFSGCTGLTSVTIPNSVTSIGYNAFYNCTSLASIEIPNSVTSIGNGAFYQCSKLTSIVLPDCIASIGHSTFEGCSSLASITIPNSVTNIGDEAFYDCDELISVTIGNSVTSIGNNAFKNCNNIIKAIWLTNTPPSGYKNIDATINYVANNQYSGLSNVEIYPYLSSLFDVDGVKYVPVSPAERTCDAIDYTHDSIVTDIKIEKSVLFKGVAMNVKKVMPYTFYANNNIETLKIDNDGIIGDNAFYGCTSLVTAALGDGIASIGTSAFSNCVRLEEIVIPDAVTVIGSNAFYNCSSLGTAKIGNGTKSINSNAFNGCASLVSITLGDSVTTIGNSAFDSCSSLSEIVIPQSVTKIENYAFDNCTSLTDVIINDRTTALSLGSNGSSPLFSDCPLDSVYIGGKITYSTSSSYGYSPFYRNTSLRSVVITDSEEEVYNNEFYGCLNLKNVSVGNGVTSIGNWAFSGCSSLDYFAFGRSVQSIGEEAFSDCNNITQIYTNATVPPVCGAQALDDINKWNCTLYVPSESKTAYQQAEQWKEFFFVNDLPTAINSVVQDKEETQPIYYDLNGRVVENPSKGIYIINGKKVYIK